MPVRTTVAISLLMLLTACSAAEQMDAAAPVAAAPRSVAADSAGADASAAVASAGPPPGASGKLSPGMVGSVSPVPAFMGQGAGFSIQIRSQGGPSQNGPGAEGMRHRVRLVRGARGVEGVLFYRAPDRSTGQSADRTADGMPSPARGAPIALDGVLETTAGWKTLRVEIVTDACTDNAGGAYPQRVTVRVQGKPRLRGCGELAVH